MRKYYDDDMDYGYDGKGAKKRGRKHADKKGLYRQARKNKEAEVFYELNGKTIEEVQAESRAAQRAAEKASMRYHDED